VIHFTEWDWALMGVVTAMSSLLAWLKSPAWKAFMLSLPLPFSCATLSLGRGVDVANVAGLIVLLLFTHGVRILYYRLKWPIVPVIAGCAIGYCLLAGALNRVLPRAEPVFWALALLVFAIGVAAFRFSPVVPEPNYRSSLPFWIKVPIIALVVVLLVAIKQKIGGFMTTFPMVGVISAYEARNSLYSVSRQIALCVFGMAVMMAVIHAAQGLLAPRFPGLPGLGLAIAMGWVVYLGLLAALTRGRWALTIPIRK
jgi:hypothetical protein